MHFDAVHIARIPMVHDGNLQAVPVVVVFVAIYHFSFLSLFFDHDMADHDNLAGL